MPAFLQSLISAHTIVVAIAAFTGISTILSAVGIYLKDIGDKVPGWLGSVISACGSVVHFLNGVQGGGSGPVA